MRSFTPVHVRPLQTRRYLLLGAHLRPPPPVMPPALLGIDSRRLEITYTETSTNHSAAYNIVYTVGPR